MEFETGEPPVSQEVSESEGWGPGVSAGTGASAGAGAGTGAGAGENAAAGGSRVIRVSQADTVCFGKTTRKIKSASVAGLLPSVFSQLLHHLFIDIVIFINHSLIKSVIFHGFG